MPNPRPAIVALSLLLLAAPGASARAADAAGLYGDYLAARFATAQSDPAMAATWYLDAVEHSPHEADLLRQAFLASALSGRAEAAGLARLLPGDRYAQLWLAEIAAKAGEWSAVETRARGLPHDGLTDVLRPLLLAWAAQAQGRTEAALGLLGPHAASGPFQGLFALHEGLIADLAGRATKATAALTQAREEQPGAPSLRLAQMLASFDARHDRQADGLGVLAQAAAAAPEIGLALPALSANAARPVVGDAAEGIAEAFLAAAGSLRMQDQGQPAMLLLRMALDLRPDLTAARLLAAELDDARLRPEAARRTLGAIGAGDPLFPLARLHLAALTARAGDTAAALETLDALALACPHSALPLARKAALLRAKGQFAEAVSVYDTAITRENADWTLYYERGSARDQAHDRAGAEADMRRALELAPEQPFVLNYLGYSWAERGEHLEDARRMIVTAAQAEPNDGAIVDSLGIVMLRQGDVAGAIAALERATELMPDDATVNGHLGDAYAAAGRRLEAGYEWRRALMLHPEPEEAERLRAKLDVPPRQSASVEKQP
ncbi:MAG: hypothetical protein ABI369_01435 [Acetobacteraceae bacterium]